MVPRFQNWKKKYFEIFFQIFSRFWNFGVLFIVKQRFLKQTFLIKGWLEVAHICYTRPSPSPPCTQIWCLILSRVTSGKSTVCICPCAPPYFPFNGRDGLDQIRIHLDQIARSFVKSRSPALKDNIFEVWSRQYTRSRWLCTVVPDGQRKVGWP